MSQKNFLWNNLARRSGAGVLYDDCFGDLLSTGKISHLSGFSRWNAGVPARTIEIQGINKAVRVRLSWRGGLFALSFFSGLPGEKGGNGELTIIFCM